MAPLPQVRPMLRLAPVALISFLVAACAHLPSNRDKRFAQIQYDLAVQATHAGRIQEAVADLQQGLDRDPDYAPAHNLLGLLYQLSLGRPKKAEAEYHEALKLKKNYSEAANNLGSLYLQTHEYVKAEKAFRLALANVLYTTPYLARGNLGWALYKQGKVDAALREIAAAVETQPKFCQGYRNLAIIYRAKGKQKRADAAVGQFVKHCPNQPEAEYAWGRVRLAAGDATGARAAFDKCVRLAKSGPLSGPCGKLLDRVGGPLPVKSPVTAVRDAAEGPDLTIPTDGGGGGPSPSPAPKAAKGSGGAGATPGKK